MLGSMLEWSYSQLMLTRLGLCWLMFGRQFKRQSMDITPL